MRIEGTENLAQLLNNTFENNIKCDIYWPGGGDNCQTMATSSPGLTVECGCCPF